MFQKGNPGKQKGTLNKETRETRLRLRLFMEQETRWALAKIKTLPDAERLKHWLDLLPYAAPMLSRVEVEGQVAMVHQTRELPGLTVDELRQIAEIEQRAIDRQPKEIKCKLEPPPAT